MAKDIQRIQNSGQAPKQALDVTQETEPSKDAERNEKPIGNPMTFEELLENKLN